MRSGQALDIATNYVNVSADGSLRAIKARGAHPNLAGFVIGAANMASNAPHKGEVHPDGDELLLVVSGRVRVILREGQGDEESVEVAGGQFFVVPRGTWHRVQLLEPAQIVHVTPGPNSRWRRSLQAVRS